MIAAIIQARMGSTRLPGKVLMDICGRPMLWYVVSRVRQSKTLDETVVATSDNASDDSVAAFCEQEGIPCFRGSEDDVLDRYYQAAKWIDADVIVRITADCPLIDPDTVDDVVRYYVDGDYNYVSNTNPPTFPDGLDVEIFSFEALEYAWYEAKWESEREHVTPYIWKHPELFRIGNVTCGANLTNMRWTVDEPQDLEFVRAVYHHLETTSFGMTEVLNVLREHSKLMNINSGIEPNDGYQKTLREDRLIDGES